MEEKLSNFNGLLCINKPKFFSSRDVVEIVQDYLPIKKIGHAGTLDPLAEGLLIVLLGRATKLFENFIKMEKEYWATFLLGASTESFDADSCINSVKMNFKIKKSKLIKTLKSFEGEISQRPPLYSALHFRGQRLYQLARRNQAPEIAPRKVRVYEAKLKRFQKTNWFYLASCQILAGRGFYVRSFAQDLGEELGTAAFLASLKRTKIGRFSLKDAVTLENFVKLAKKGKLEKILRTIV